MEAYIINRIFPIIDNKLLLKYDDEGIWSISLPNDAEQISLLIKNNFGTNINILDATAGIGGNIISFAKYFNNVHGVEINKDRYDILENNVKIFGLNNVTLINDNCMNYLNSFYNIFFFDPPWGGRDYKYKKNLRFKLGIYTLNEIINKIKIIKKSIVFKLPNNYDLNEFNEYDYNIIKINNYQIILIK